jgi:hypothetical protein
MASRAQDPNALLFLGAGASRAFGFPTTKEFLDHLKVGAFPEQSALLGQFTLVSGIADIEHVLDILDQIVSGDNPLVKYLAFHQHKMGPSYDAVEWSVFKEKTSALREHIRVELFREYEFVEERRHEIQKRLETVLGHVRSGNVKVMNIFTTNYDSVIEKGLARSQSYELVDGFREEVTGEPAEWDPTIFDETSSSEKVRVNLFKLRGSLSWRTAKKTGKILRVDTEEKSIAGSKRFGENLLLYPASKVPPIKEPFGMLYTHFARKLLSARTCFAIGFSFRDPYLNTVFMDFLRRDRGNMLCIISPSADESLRNLFDKANPTEIPEGVARQVVALEHRFEDRDTEGMITAVTLQQAKSL